MRKSLLTLLMFTLLAIVPFKKSNAGVIIVASGAASGGALVSGYVLVGLGLAGSAAAIKTASEDSGGMYDFSSVFAILLGVPSLVVLTLDADGALPQDTLALQFSKNYPFIENSEVINQLAEVVKEKAGSNFMSNEERMVSLSREEVLAALSPLDLTGLDEEVEFMIKDLE